MTQYVINIGALPNDGTGDPLRTAFNETNLNFDQVFAAGPVLSNIQIANNTILVTNTNGNLVLATNGVGKIQAAADVVPSVNLARNLGSSTQKWNTIYSQYITISGDATVAGNLSVAGNIIQVGNIVTDALTIQLANTAASANAANGSGITVGANDNIATILYNSTSNAWTTNIGISAVGNISAPYFIGNGSQLTGLAATYGNANVATFLAGFGSNSISTTGNVTSGNLRINSTANIDVLNVNSSGNTWTISGNILTAPSNAIWQSDPATLDEYINSAPDGYINLTSLYANANIASQLHLEHGLAQIITQDGNLSIWEFDSTGNLTLPGNTFAVNYANGTPVTFSANTGNVTFDDINIIGTGNLHLQPDPANSASYLDIFLTSGPDLHLVASNGANLILGEDAGANVMASWDGNVTVQSWNSNTGNAGGTWIFDNTGNLTLPQGMIVSGNTNFLGTDTALLNPTDNTPLSLFSSGANGTVTSFWTDDVGNLMTSNIAALYLPLQGSQTVRIVTGNNGGNIAIYDFDPDGMFTAGAVCATGNVYASNVSASGNVTGNYILGNGSQLTNLPAPAVAQDITSNGAMSIMLYDGNIKYNNYATVEPASGNITGGNISATGNISGNYILGNVAFANGIPATYGNVEVANFMANYGSNTISLTGTITTGNVFVNGEVSTTGNIIGANVIGYSVYANGIISATGNVDARAFHGNLFGNNSLSNLTITSNDHFQFNIGNVANTVYITDGGMLIGGTGFISASGNISGANVNATGLITGANIYTGGRISAAGEINGANLVISGAINGNTVSANTYTGGNISATGNITGGNLITAGSGGDITLTGGNIVGANIISASGNITGGNIVTAGNVSGNTAGYAIGYRDIPQVSFTGNATIATTDAGKHYYSTLSTGNVLTIANNASQGFQVGAAITVVNQGTGNITVAQGSGVTLYLAGNATAGNRTVATFGMATIMKVATDTWFINGTGVS